MQLGTTNHVFNNAFTWDGTSNIIIEVCFNNDFLGFSSNPSIPYTSTGFTSVCYFRDDDNSSVCSEPTGNTSSDRPYFKLYQESTDYITLWTNATGGIAVPSDDITDATPTTSGTYYLTVTNSGGCSVMDSVDVTLNATPTADATNTNNVLIATPTGMTYQWIDCGNGNIEITGETNETFAPTVAGSYAVIVTDNGCPDTSACIEANVGIDELFANNVSLHPNPKSGEIFISFEGEEAKVEILNAAGAIVRTISTQPGQMIEVKDLTSGVYYFNITIDGAKHAKRIIKF